MHLLRLFGILSCIALGESAVISYKMSIFKDLREYVSWTQYLCQVIRRADDMDRLEECTFRLHNLMQQLPQVDQHIPKSAYSGLIKELNERRKYKPWNRTITDPTAEAIVNNIWNGRLAESKRQIHGILDKRQDGDYRGIPEAQKRVILINGLLLIDALDSFSILPLWSRSWHLSLDEKLAAVFRAPQVIQALRDGKDVPPARFLFSSLTKLEARLRANLGADITSSLLEPSSDRIEKGLLQAATKYAIKDYCGALRILKELIPFAAGRLDPFKKRLEKKCGGYSLYRNYNIFCQRGTGSIFPISQAVHDNGECQGVALLERMFWVRQWIGECDGAAADFRALKSQLPPHLLKERPYLQRRLSYMSTRSAQCKKNALLYSHGKLSVLSQTMLTYLQHNETEQAEGQWQQKFSSQRDSPLAKLWRMAIIINKYPQAIYSPCTGNSLLAGDATLDARILERVSLLTINHNVKECWQKDPKEKAQCRLLWAKAAYIVNKPDLVLHYTRLILTHPDACNEAHQLEACVHLCSNGLSQHSGCEALTQYRRMCPRTIALRHNSLGQDIAEQICLGKISNSEGGLDIRYGATLRPISSLFKTYYPSFYHVRKLAVPRKHGSLCECKICKLNDSSLLKAHEIICPCVKFDDKMRKKILKLYKSKPSRSERKSKVIINDLPMKKVYGTPTVDKKEIAKLRINGALRAAALMYKSGQLLCPCLQNDLILNLPSAPTTQILKDDESHSECFMKSLQRIQQNTRKMQEELVQQQVQLQQDLQNRILMQRKQQQQIMMQNLQREEQLRQTEIRKQMEMQKLIQKRLLQEQRVRMNDELQRQRLMLQRQNEINEQLMRNSNSNYTQQMLNVPSNVLTGVACHLKQNCAKGCLQSALARYPRLKTAIVKSRNVPCEKMGMPLRRLYCGLLHQIQSPHCSKGMTQCQQNLF